MNAKEILLVSGQEGGEGGEVCGVHGMPNLLPRSASVMPSSMISSSLFKAARGMMT
jgi:hypothetical protein